MRKIMLKAVDEFDKKLYSVSAIDFKRNKISVQFRGNLENIYDYEDIRIIQSTEMIDDNGNEIYESDLLSDGLKTFCISYNKRKGLYCGTELDSAEEESLETLLSSRFVIVGNFYIQKAR